MGIVKVVGIPDRVFPIAALLVAIYLCGGCGPARPRDDESAGGSDAGTPAALVTGADSETLVAAYRDGAAAFGTGEFTAAATAFERALAVNPGDEVATYLEAAAWALAGDDEQALASLERLAALGSDLIPRPQTFEALQGSAEFARVMTAIRSGARRCDRSETAFTVPERDLFPEGIAYDPVEDAFYLGSLYKTKVVRVRRRASGPAIDDFVGEGQYGLYSVLGMKVDPERRLLWLASSADPPYRGFDEADRGKTAVHAFDLVTGEPRHRFAIEEGDSPHLFNDLDVSADGEVYLSDTATGEIYHLDPEVGELATLLPAGTFPGANGIVLSDDDSRLFVATWEEGLSVVDLATLAAARLAHPPGVSTHGPDGIYFHEGSLIAVYNSVGPGRVVRFWLDEDQTAITRAEILECNHPLFAQPTTGALATDGFYFIANSQFARFDPDNQPPPLDQLAKIVVLRIPL
jgi:sugar lactone lactonase YvrE